VLTRSSESYKDFVSALQKDISESLSARPRVADEAYFNGKVLKTPTGDVEITPQLAKQIYKYLLKNDYTDDADRITSAYHDARKDGRQADLPPELKPHTDQVFQLIDSVQRESASRHHGRQTPEEKPAQRELQETGVQGAVEPAQPQGGLQRRI
jgi:type III restriction enzyme